MKANSLVGAALPARPWLRVAHCAQLLGVLTSLPALAAPDQVIKPYVGFALSNDDNLLGASADADGADTSSTARQASAGVLIDKRVSQQALSAELHFTRHRYAQMSELNNDAKDLRANWNWRVGNHVDGNVGASYVQALAPFVNFHARERNVRTERREYADGGWLLHPSWRVRSAVTRTTLAHDLEVQRSGDRVERVGELGLDYLARSGSTVGTQLRRTRGNYPHRQQAGVPLVDSSYSQNELKAKVKWLITNKTQLQFLGGLVERKHDAAFAARDYRGLNARVNANWQTSAKLGVALAAWREIGALDDVSTRPEDITTSYTLNRGVSLGTAWEVTDKVRLNAQLRHETSDYSATATAASTLAERKDTLRRATLQLVYRATSHLKLSAQAYRNERRSIQAGKHPGSGLQLSSKYEF